MQCAETRSLPYSGKGQNRSAIIRRRPVPSSYPSNTELSKQDLHSPLRLNPRSEPNLHRPPQSNVNINQPPFLFPRNGFDSSNDFARDDLFGNRSAPPQPSSQRTAPHRNPYDDESQGPNQDWELDAIEQETRFVKQNSLASTENAIRIGLHAEETGRNTLVKLADQSQKLAFVDKSLDVSAAHARKAHEKAKELKKVDGSMFGFYLRNPLTAKKRAEEEEKRILAVREMERLQRERNPRDTNQSVQRVNKVLAANTKRVDNMKPSRNPYSFGDEEDVEIDRAINANLDVLAGVSSRLKDIALATQAEVDLQIDTIDAIDVKITKLDNSVVRTTHQLNTIK